jgi:hypothetical protein
MKPTRHHEQPFSINTVFYTLLSALVLTLITVRSFLPSALDQFDKWTNDMEHQVALVLVFVSMLGIFALRWLINKVKE